MGIEYAAMAMVQGKRAKSDKIVLSDLDTTIVNTVNAAKNIKTEMSQALTLGYSKNTSFFNLELSGWDGIGGNANNTKRIRSTDWFKFGEDIRFVCTSATIGTNLLWRDLDTNGNVTSNGQWSWKEGIQDVTIPYVVNRQYKLTSHYTGETQPLLIDDFLSHVFIYKTADKYNLATNIRTNLGELGMFEVFSHGAVNFDTSARTITIPSGIRIIWRNQYYQPPSTITVAMPASADWVALYFDTNTKAFTCRGTGTMSTTSETEILLATGSSTQGSFTCFGEYTINGKSNTVALPNAIPNYDVAEIATTKKSILNAQTVNSTSFAFITDTHYSKGLVPVINGLNALNDVMKNVNLSFIAVGGDLIDNDTKINTLADYDDLMYQFRNSINNAKVLTVKGNHDDNSIYNIQYVAKTPDVDTILPSEQYVRAFKQNESTVTNDLLHKDKLYYYIDINETKIRCLFLNIVDIPYIRNADGSWKYRGQWDYGFSNEQLNWVANTALDFSSKGTDKGNWKVLIFTHVPLEKSLTISGNETIHNGDIMLSILNAYKNGASYTSTSTTGDFAQSVSKDFSSQGVMKLLAVIYGHCHGDRVNLINGITYISTTCARTGLSLDGDPATMTTGTVTESAWDIYTIDKDNNKIFITRFGAGGDRTINGNSISVNVNSTVTLTTSLTGTTITWTAIDTTIATVKNKVVTGVANGTTLIKASDENNNKEYWTIKVGS